MAEITPSQYFVNFLENNLVDTVFTVSGGSIHNVLSALDKSNKVWIIDFGDAKIINNPDNLSISIYQIEYSAIMYGKILIFNK